MSFTQNYRMNVWFKKLSDHDDKRDENELEHDLIEALSHAGLVCQGGPIVFKTLLPFGG